MVAFTHDAQACIDLVEKSPVAVAAHDKQAWLSLFAHYSLVEDPVGSRPCVSRPGDPARGGPLSNFYDAFIAPNDIRFRVERDIVCGNRVWRDLDMEITLGSGAVVCTPMHLLYELVDEQGQLKVFRLAAHWEFVATAKQQSGGLGAFLPIVRQLGLMGTVGYLRALRSVGERGKQRVSEFSGAVAAHDSETISQMFSADQPLIKLAATGDRVSISEFLLSTSSLSFTKMLAAGPFVTASFDLQSQQDGKQSSRQGVALFRLATKTCKIDELELFWDCA